MTSLARTGGVAACLLAGALGAIGACSSSRSATPLGEPGMGDAGIDSSIDATDDGGQDGEAEAPPHDGAVDGSAARDGATDAPPPSIDAGDSGAYMPPPVNAACSPTAMWGAGTLLSVSTASDDELDAITPDELTIAWTRGSGATAAVLVADRAATNDPFGAPQSLAAGQFTADRVALSPDGLRLVVVDADAQGFSELTRTSRPGAFGAPAIGSYTNLDGALSAGLSYGDPLLGADDSVFYYSIYGAGQTITVFRAERLLPTDPWSSGAPLPSSGLAAQGALRCRPTGISSDEQTLFVWDQLTGTERAAWIDASTGSYDTFVDLGARSMAAANAACTALYYSAAGTSSIDLFVATP